MQSHRLPIEDVIAEHRAEAAEAGAASPDPYGVPSNMFGPVPEEFYGLVGRITMIWPVVESQLHWLGDTITGDSQDVAAGFTFVQLVERCEKALKTASDAMRSTLVPVLAQVRSVAQDRNAIVHSLWPDPTLDRADGHRPVRPKHREQGSSSWSVSTHVSETTMRQMITAEVEAIEALEAARFHIQALCVH